jgi:UDP-N-acetyl-2-amino-2-deoxyglucuronate dehydrogenase
MQKSATVRIAIIGAGFISEYHIDGIRAAGGAEIATLVGRRADNTARRAGELGIANYTIDYHAVLADKSIDAVVIATPDSTHLPLAEQALAAGKDVLLQKPMAMNSDECRKIIKAAAESDACLTVSFMHRYFPEIRWLRERIAENTFGRVHSVRIRNATPGAGWSDWFYDASKVAGGVVMQLGVHGIDLLQHLFGPLQSVAAMATTMKPDRNLDDGRKTVMTFEDNVAAIYRLAGGANATHEMSWTEIAGCDRFRLEVYFEDGTVWLRTDKAAAMLNRTGPSGWSMVDLPDEPLGMAHHKHWLEIVRRNAPVDDTALAGLSTHIVAEQLYRAIDEGKTLPISGS